MSDQKRLNRIAALAAIFTASALWTNSRPASAAITLYTDRAAYLAAIGTPKATEDFQGFQFDTSFLTSPVTCNGFSLSAEGTNQNFRELVDVAPLQYGDNDGTAGASCFTNFAEVGTPATNVRVSMAPGTGGFGADFVGVGVPADEGLIADIIANNAVVSSYTFPTATNGTGASFFGAVDTSNSIDSILLRSATLVNGTSGDGFTFDNAATSNFLASVPEPTVGLASLAAGLLLAGRNTRKTRRA